ncbi:hypothetical protein PV325_011675 [Microctonus aethiopoides]|nr:hypothetical protein PV325_011675 [Microctonus aethiopoides]
MSVSICAGTFASFLFTTNIYTAGQFKILQRKLEFACDMKTIKNINGISTMTINDACIKLKECIQQHQLLIFYIERVENLYSTIMLVQALGGVLQMCFSGFQIVLGAEDSIVRTVLSIQFLTGAVIQLFLFSWSCHEIIIESQMIAEAAYRGSWHILPFTNEGKMYRECLLIIIARARKPCILTVGKFTPMSLETFTSAVSQNLPASIVVAVELSNLVKFVFNRREVIKLNAYTENIFWKITYEASDLNILHECNRKSMRIIISHIIFSQSVVWLYVSIPMIESIGKNSSDRTLPITLYFNFPYTTTPYYEIAYILEFAAVIGTGICTTTFAGFLGITNLYLVGQFKILQRHLECSIYDMSTVDKNNSTSKATPNYMNIRDCIKKHQLLLQYLERVENLFMIQLYLFAWPCHEIMIESQEVAEAAYRASWFCLPHSKDGRTCRQFLLIVITRARKPCLLTVGKFTPMSFQTFSLVFNKAISYFMILRRLDEPT